MRRLSEEEQAENKKALGRLVRLYKRVFSIPGLILLIVVFTLTGYTKGYLDGYLARPTMFQQESKK